MCHKGTKLAALAVLSWSLAFGQNPVSGPEWRRIGNASIEMMLAAPVTGPVDAVWYSADGARLYARTRSGRVFETADFETWTRAAGAVSPPGEPLPATVERLPERGARLATGESTGRVYALAQQLYRSEDGGRSWTNLTAFGAKSVIGEGQHSLAVSPADPDQLVVANDYGVWRSLDGGLSWTGLNQYLPNLMAHRILATPSGRSGARLLVPEVGVVELAPGARGSWMPSQDAQLERQIALRRNYSVMLKAEVTAVAGSGETVYAGGADGRMWVSFDGGRSWPTQRPGSGGAVEALFVDPEQPRIALAALAGAGPRVLRTTNSGAFWDDLSANLPEGPAHAVAAERSAGAIYVATDRGVFWARADLENPAPAAVNWILLTANLPEAPATDVKLGQNGNQLYIALEGYGLYATAAPHRNRTLRLVNAADFSTRPAAPGSLLSILGGRVSAAAAGALDFPVLAVSDRESQIQVPFEAPSGNLSLALRTGEGTVTLGLPVQAVSPAIFISPDGAPMLLDADTGLMLESDRAAHSNARIQVLATGLGRVQPEWPTGLAAPLENPPVVAAAVKAYLDRVPVEVTRAALAPGYSGFYLIEVQLPAIVNAGPVELYITADGQESNRVRVLLEP